MSETDPSVGPVHPHSHQHEMTSVMATGRERAFGRDYTPLVGVLKPCNAFRDMGNKTKAFERSGLRAVVRTVPTPPPTANTFSRVYISSVNNLEKEVVISRKGRACKNNIEIEFACMLNISAVEPAIEKARVVQKTILLKKKARSIKLIDVSEVRVPVGDMHGSAKTRASLQKCKAITMSNKPCPFKAVCGNFCRRHKINE